jgi:hypothetical protein
MTVPVLQVLIDWDNDGSFATAGDDITADITAAGVSWDRGRSADFTADSVGSATFALDNSTGRYSPATNANLAIGRPVLIKSTYSGTEYPHFYGYIQRISPDPKTYTTTITVYDPRGAMGRVSTTLPTASRTHREIRIDALNTFGAAWRNLVDFNPQFATNTTGWTAAAGTLTRKTDDNPPVTGVSTCVELTHTAQAKMNCRTFDTTFAVNDIVHVSFWAKWISGTNNAGQSSVIITNPAGSAIGSKSITLPATWGEVHEVITIASASVGAQVWIKTSSASNPQTVRVGAIQVTKGIEAHSYSATGGTNLSARPTNIIANPSFEIPFDAGSTGVWRSEASAWQGAGAAQPARTDLTGIFTPSSASGRYVCGIYAAAGANTGAKWTGFGSRTFFANQPYTFVIWARQQSASVDWDLGIGSNSNSADYAHTSFTSDSTTFVEYHTTWTPAADRTDVFAYLAATSGASANTLFIDAVACYPGTTVYPFDPAYSSLDAEDGRSPDNASSGTIKSILDEVNGVTLTRHWVEATLTSPYWIYKTENLDTIKAKTSVETFTDGDFVDLTNSDISDDAVINVQKVIPGTKYINGSGATATYAESNSPIAYASDGASVDLIGVRLGSDISSALIECNLNDTIYQQALADNVVLLNSSNRSRPVMKVINRFPSQLILELNDLITLSLDRLDIVSQDYCIIKSDTTVNSSGLWWTTDYTLEENVL